MTLGTKSNCETYYDILRVKEVASYEEIRQSYRSALLQSHPDKIHHSLSSRNSGEDVEERFAKVQQAWETLSDSNLRVMYDNKLQNTRTDELVSEEITLEYMTPEASGETFDFFYGCRCGDFFLISWRELENMGFELREDGNEIFVQTSEAMLSCVILHCGSCSLRISLSIEIDCSVPVD